MSVQEIKPGDLMLCDSRETQLELHANRIKQLEFELNQLNLLENPCEIIALCKQIMVLRESLLKISPSLKL